MSAFNKYIKEKLVVNQLCEEIHSIVCEIVIFISFLYHLRQFHLVYNSKPETTQNLFMNNLFFFELFYIQMFWFKNTFYIKFLFTKAVFVKWNKDYVIDNLKTCLIIFAEIYKP